jgi:hypothetical protein
VRSHLILIARALLILYIAIGNASAQSQRTEHTFRLDDPEQRPAATLDDVSWLVGSWAGEAFGKPRRRHWMM